MAYSNLGELSEGAMLRNDRGMNPGCRGQLCRDGLETWTRARSLFPRRLAIAALLLSACQGSSARAAPPAGSSITAPRESASALQQRADTPPSAPATFVVVDDRGFVIGGERIEATAADTDQRLTSRLTTLPLDDQPVSVRAASAAKLSQVAILIRALGQLGASEIDFRSSLPDAEASSATLKVWPLGRVPMHTKRCGVHITVKPGNTAELKWAQKGKAVTIPWSSNGPNLSPVVALLRERMKTCPSTVWMLSADGDATWGTAFEIGIAVSRSTESASQIRYLMIL